MDNKNNMKNENEILIDCIKKTLWMARRYAHGRHTYAPSDFREAYNKLQEIGVHIARDEVIDSEFYEEGKGLQADYLNDCNSYIHFVKRL